MQTQIGISDFEQARMLGRGAYGMVRVCKKKDTGKLYAMKQINKDKMKTTESAKNIMFERNVLSDMDSVFVTSLHYAFIDHQALYLILDLMLGGDLKYHLNNDSTFSEEKSRFYAAEVLLGLDHIHNKGIIFRDIKLENILLDEQGHCKISDFGLAVRKNKDSVRGYAGTPGYTAPEVVLSGYYDHTVDFFSFGVLIYRFLCGKKPFRQIKKKATETMEEYRKRRIRQLDRDIIETEPLFPATDFTPHARSMLKGLLSKDPRKRLGRNGIEEIIQHSWFDSIDFGLLEVGDIDPPFVPSTDAGYFFRSSFDEMDEREEIEPVFDERFEEFPYVSKKAILEEIAEVLKTVDAERRVERKSQGDNPGQAL